MKKYTVQSLYLKSNERIEAFLNSHSENTLELISSYIEELKHKTSTSKFTSSTVTFITLIISIFALLLSNIGIFYQMYGENILKFTDKFHQVQSFSEFLQSGEFIMVKDLLAFFWEGRNLSIILGIILFCFIIRFIYYYNQIRILNCLYAYKRKYLASHSSANQKV